MDDFIGQAIFYLLIFIGFGLLLVIAELIGEMFRNPLNFLEAKPIRRDQNDT
jgi:hypothetical protein